MTDTRARAAAVLAEIYKAPVEEISEGFDGKEITLIADAVAQALEEHNTLHNGPESMYVPRLSMEAAVAQAVEERDAAREERDKACENLAHALDLGEYKAEEIARLTKAGRQMLKAADELMREALRRVERRG